MGISKVIVYTVICDKCGKGREMHYGGNVSISGALNASGYEKIKAKYLCPECAREERSKN